VEEKPKKLNYLQNKVQTKDAVMAELMAEHPAVNKTFGEL